MDFEPADRMKGLSLAVFAEMNKAKEEVIAKGQKVIDLSIGSPDRPPAPHIVEALKKGVCDMNNYGYPMTGLPELKEAVARWYKKRFNVELDPREEVLVLMGSHEGLAHISLAFINPGDIFLVPDPGYPIYTAGPVLAGARVYYVPLIEEKGFLPCYEDVPTEIAEKAKMMFLNYPNNPVAAVANREFFEETVKFAERYNIIVCHDVSYSELAFDGFKPMSFLEVPGAKDIGVEFYSVSKSYNMAGCRLGFVVGNREVISGLSQIKSHIDYGVFKPIQMAGIAALEGSQDFVAENAKTYERRRDILVDGLRSMGWNVTKPKATMFIWAPVPGEDGSLKFAIRLLEEAGILTVPGIGFGQGGEGYIRIALVQEEDILIEAVERIKNSRLRVGL